MLDEVLILILRRLQNIENILEKLCTTNSRLKLLVKSSEFQFSETVRTRRCTAVQVERTHTHTHTHTRTHTHTHTHTHAHTHTRAPLFSELQHVRLLQRGALHSGDTLEIDCELKLLDSENEASDILFIT